MARPILWRGKRREHPRNLRSFPVRFVLGKVGRIASRGVRRVLREMCLVRPSAARHVLPEVNRVKEGHCDGSGAVKSSLEGVHQVALAPRYRRGVFPLLLLLARRDLEKLGENISSDVAGRREINKRKGRFR